MVKFTEKFQIKDFVAIQMHFSSHLKFILTQEAKNNLYFFEYAMLYIYMQLSREEKCSPYHVLHRPVDFLEAHKLLTTGNIKMLIGDNPEASTIINKKLSAIIVKYPDILEKVVGNIVNSINKTIEGDICKEPEIILWYNFIQLSRAIHPSNHIPTNDTINVKDLNKMETSLKKLLHLKLPYKNKNVLEETRCYYKILALLNQFYEVTSEENNKKTSIGDEIKGHLKTNGDVDCVMRNIDGVINKLYKDKLNDVLATGLINKIVADKKKKGMVIIDGH